MFGGLLKLVLLQDPDGFKPLGLSQDRMDDVTMNVGQSEISTCVSKSHPLVIVPHQVQDGCVQIMNRYGILNGLEPEFIGRSVNHPSSNTTSRHPNGESPVVMVSPLASTTTVLSHFDGGSSAEFPGTQDECLIEQPSLFQIDEQSCES